MNPANSVSVCSGTLHAGKGRHDNATLSQTRRRFFPGGRGVIGSRHVDSASRAGVRRALRHATFTRVFEELMQVPLQITFRNMQPSPAVESRIRERAAKLERFHQRITSCHVVIDAPHRHHNKGKLFAVHVDLTVPGQEILASKGAGPNHAHENVHVAIRDAFDAVLRQLDGFARRARGDVKYHEPAAETVETAE